MAASDVPSAPDQQATQSPPASNAGTGAGVVDEPSTPASGGAAAQPPTNVGGSPADDPMSQGDPVETEPDPSSGQMPPPEEEVCELAMDECPELNSGWPGDEFCIQPPPPDQGFQVHVGPPDYNNPPAEYLTPPGADTDRIFSAVSGNDEEVFYYYREYRMRPGSHHLILSTAGGGGASSGFDIGRRLGGSSNSAKDNPECGEIAPENSGIGMRLGPRTNITVNLHYFNVGDEPALNETWVNFWYRDPADVKEEAQELFALGDVAFAIPPGANQTLGPYTCNVGGSGRVLSMYGHYHANTVRFSAWRIRGGQRELILEDYDWHDPLILEFSSLVENPAPNPDLSVAGGWNGILDLQPGDQLQWECEVHNMTDGTLRFANEAVTGEMCILVGDTAGTGCSGGLGF